MFLADNLYYLLVLYGISITPHKKKAAENFINVLFTPFLRLLMKLIKRLGKNKNSEVSRNISLNQSFK